MGHSFNGTRKIGKHIENNLNVNNKTLKLNQSRKNLCRGSCLNPDFAFRLDSLNLNSHLLLIN